MCGNGQNHTHKDVYAYFASQRGKVEAFDHSRETGTGIFVIPDPAAGILEEKKVLVKDLTYKETIKRGMHCISFSFVPSSLMPFERLSVLSCSYNCPGGVGCPAGCACGGFGCF